MPPELLLKIAAWRAPIFMVDRIADFIPGENGKIVVVKHVTFNEPYIAGHFPDYPVMPGVLISETFGQASEYLTLLNDFCTCYEAECGTALKKFDDVAKALLTPAGESIILRERKRFVGFLAAQDVKFKHTVHPGDTIYVESALTLADVNGFHHYKVEAHAGRFLASEGKIVNYRAERTRAEKVNKFSI